MPKDVRMGDSHETEESWEILSRIASSSSTDSRTPVALHFPIGTVKCPASVQLDQTVEPPPNNLHSPPKRVSLDDRGHASRRRFVGRRFRRRTVAAAKKGASEEDSTMGACVDSDSSSKSIPGLQHPVTPLQPPQQFYGVLAGDAWYSVPGPLPAVTSAPITIVFVGVGGSGKTSTCLGFSGSSSGTGASTVGTKGTTVVLKGQQVTIVDTAGLGQPAAQDAVLATLREQSLQGASVVLALTVSICMSFDEGQALALSALLAAAGPGAATHAVLVFTHGDASDEECSFLPNYLDEAPAALQELARAVGGRTTLVTNPPEAAFVSGSSSPQVLRMLALASNVAALGDSAPWVGHVRNDDLASQPGIGSDVSRMRKAVVYSLAACGMMGLRVLTSGGNSLMKKRGGSSSWEDSLSGFPTGRAPHLCNNPLVWHLDEDSMTATDAAGSEGNQRSIGEAFEVSTSAL